MDIERRVLYNGRGSSVHMLYFKGEREYYLKTRHFLGLLAHCPGFHIRHMETWEGADFFRLSENGMERVERPNAEDVPSYYLSSGGMLIVASVLYSQFRPGIIETDLDIEGALRMEREIQIRVAIKRGVPLASAAQEYVEDSKEVAAVLKDRKMTMEAIMKDITPKPREIISFPLAAFLYQRRTQPLPRKKLQERRAIRHRLNPEAAEFTID